MKKIILVILILSTANIKAQYQSMFGDTKTEWNFIALYCDAAFVETFIHEKDTILNTVKYRIINNWGLLRESDQNSKVWYRNFNDENEILIFDLSLNIGDTFKINAQNFIVDAVYEEDSMKIIEFDYKPQNCGFYERLKFKEGRGPNQGYKFSITANEDDTKLLRCQTKDSITFNFLEQFGFGKDCQKDIVNVKEIEAGEVHVFPNPINEELSIQFFDNNFRTIELYNLNGVQLFNQNTSQEFVKIKTDELTKGMYIIKIQESDIVKTFKVVKQN